MQERPSAVLAAPRTKRSGAPYLAGYSWDTGARFPVIQEPITGTQPTRAANPDLWAFIAVALVALIARLVILPFATSDGGDSVSRVWMAQEWMSRPRLLTEGIWGPLHFYLLALPLALVPDPVHGPIAMGVLFSTASALLMYRLVEIQFGDQRAALLVALTYALYPIAIRNGVSVRSETPFVFFLLLAMIALALARREGGSWRHAVAGGVALTLASMLRYEAWMLIPMLAVLLWRKPRFLLVFVGCALVHPVFWMIGNAVQHGDPFFSMTAASRFELQTMGRSRLDRWSLVRWAALYPGVVLRGMGLVAAVISLIGAAWALIGRHRSAAWLVPLAGLTSLQCLAIARGSLVPKLNYTETAGTMLFPFAALVYDRIRVARWTAAAFGLVTLGLLVANAVTSCKPCLARVGLGAAAASSPVPRIPNEEIALELPPILADNLPAGSGLISDDYGTGATRYVALQTRLPRERMYFVCAAVNRPLDVPGLSVFLGAYPRGMLVARSGSRFSENLGLTPLASSTTIGDTQITLEPLRSLNWPGRVPAELTLFRYAVRGGGTPPPSRPPNSAHPSTPGCSPRDAAADPTETDGSDTEPD